MDTNTLAKFRLFGKTGKILMTVLSIITALIAVSCCAATAFVAALPEDALKVRVVERTQLHFNAESFQALWNILGGSFSYAGEGSLDDMLKENGRSVMPPENTEFSTELKLFHRSYDSAEIHTDGDAKVMDAESDPAEYNAKNLIQVFAFAALLAASAAAALWMLRRLFAVLTTCTSPFCGEVVAKMRAFGFSLLPVFIFASVSETLLEGFLSAGKSSGLQVQWGVLIAFAVTMALVAVFRYGVQLQKESDETL